MWYLDFEHSHEAVLEIWDKHLPWDTKVEGSTVFDMTLPFSERVLAAPPMVSRRLVVMDEILWEPLINISRSCRRLVHEERRSIDLEIELVLSAFSTNALMIHWHVRGRIYSPAVANLIRVFGQDYAMDLVKAMAGRMYRYA